MRIRARSLIVSLAVVLAAAHALPDQAAPLPATYTAMGSGAGPDPAFPGNFADVRALVYGPDGALYAGGDFVVMDGVTVNHIARWDGSSWTSLGSGLNGSVEALAFDSSGTLYAGGEFTQAGGTSAAHVARWNGTGWSALGSGMSGGSGTIVKALVIAGSTLYAGGVFTTAGGIAAANIAAWSNSAWSPLGTGVNDRVRALLWDGTGTLYATGDFTSPSGRIAAWNGTSWAALSSGLNGGGYALAMQDGVLYVGGSFTDAGGQAAGSVAAWNGSGWFVPSSSQLNYVVHALVPRPDGSIIAGGAFTVAGSTSMLRLASWDGSEWSQLGSGVAGTFAVDYVGAMTSAPDGSLVIGGQFSSAGGVSARNIARVRTGGSSAQAPPPILQGLPLNAQGTCLPLSDAAFAYGTGLSGGWVRAWQDWMPDAAGNRVGGWGCSRTLVHTGTTWIVDNG